MPFNREKFKRTELMLGSDAMDRLEASAVTVIGLGAVGSHAIEALARSGIGTLRIVDFDAISTSNFNRQLLAVEANIGRQKTDAAYERLKQINPDMTVEVFETLCHVDTFGTVFDPVPPSPHPPSIPVPGDAGVSHQPSTATNRCSPMASRQLESSSGTHHVVIDAIDSLNPKVNLLYELIQRKMKVVSCMGAARRTDPAAIKTGDISDTIACPLAKSVRKRLRRRGVESGIHCIYSTEIAKKESVSRELEENFLNSGRLRNPMGSLSMISGIFGYIAALEALKLILDEMIEW